MVEANDDLVGGSRVRRGRRLRRPGRPGRDEEAGETGSGSRSESPHQPTGWSMNGRRMTFGRPPPFGRNVAFT